MSQVLLKSEIRTENDIVSARKRAREIAAFVLIDKQEQIRLATAVSEMARNVFQYAKNGIIEFSFSLENEAAWLVVEIRDKGPGISSIKTIMDGRYVSPEGMGIGIIGSQKLVDKFDLKTSSEGTTVTLKKIVPLRRSLLNPRELTKLMDSFVSQTSHDTVEEIQKQNQEILLTIGALNEKKEELSRLNKELEETNRGVVALYAELDEKAESLRRANESKTSFLSDMTHEFRSPLNSILSISNFLLEDAQDEKNPERVKQIQYIMKAARGLSDLVNDLLDIAKIEAGKIPVRLTEFTVKEMFGTLRGLMRPLALMNEKVELIFEDIPEEMKLKTDEAKVTQMLRNIISNALKYTETGTIIVSATRLDNHCIEFIVTDTGIGIRPEDQEIIFSEFGQVENKLQEKTKGTGLGLPLTKKLATLLGGDISVKSDLGKGSAFIIRIPDLYSGPEEAIYNAQKQTPTLNNRVTRVLLVDDDDIHRSELRKIADKYQLDSRQATNGKDGLQIASIWVPDLIVLDLVMPIMDGYEFIREAMASEKLRNVPIILNTSKDLSKEELTYLEQVTSTVLQKNEKDLGQIENIFRQSIGTQGASGE